MDIEGLGDKQIEYFYEEGLIRTPSDIFTLAERDAKSLSKLKNREGFGETSVRNLFEAIEARRSVPVNRFIHALGIRHVGETNARRLARGFGDFAELREAARKLEPGGEGEAAFDGIDGIGPVVIEALRDFFTEPHNEKELDRLLEEVTLTPMEAVEADLARLRQDGRLHRKPRSFHARRGQGAGRAARREGLGLDLEEDRSRRRRPRRGLEARQGARARRRGAHRRGMASADRAQLGARRR